MPIGNSDWTVNEEMRAVPACADKTVQTGLERRANPGSGRHADCPVTDSRTGSKPRRRKHAGESRPRSIVCHRRLVRLSVKQVERVAGDLTNAPKLLSGRAWRFLVCELRGPGVDKRCDNRIQVTRGWWERATASRAHVIVDGGGIAVGLVQERPDQFAGCGGIGSTGASQSTMGAGFHGGRQMRRNFLAIVHEHRSGI
jgi:hypothetical protein